MIGPEAIRVRPDPLSLLPPTEEARIYAEREAEAPAMTLMAPGAHFWFPKNGLMITAEGRVCPYSFPGDRLDEKLRAFNQVVWRTRESGTEVAVFHPEAMRICLVIADEALLVSTADRANFGHYLLDMPPLISVGCAKRPTDVELAARAMAAGDFATPGRSRQPFAGNRRAPNAAAPARRQQPPQGSQHMASSSAFARCVRSRFALQSASPPTRACPWRFFVARSQRHSRGLKNRAAVIDALASFGIVAVQPERMSFDAQAEMFSRASLVVAEFGAALVNVGFCPPDATVVEIVAEEQWDTWSTHLCGMLGLRHIQLFQSF